MKIVDRKTFLALPPNTVFAKYSPCNIGELKVKLESWTNDFIYFGFDNPLDKDNEVFIDTCERMGAGESAPLDIEATARDGCFDENQLFCVYDKDDVQAIICKLKECL
jgi:hypothetical protein